jgi:hypothetical protein
LIEEKDTFLFASFLISRKTVSVKLSISMRQITPFNCLLMKGNNIVIKDTKMALKFNWLYTDGLRPSVLYYALSGLVVFLAPERAWYLRAGRSPALNIKTKS